MEPTLIPTLGTTGTDDTLLGILQKISELQSRPVIPDNPMARLFTGLAGFGAAVQGKPNPVLEMAKFQREQQLDELKASGTLATAVEQLKQKREDQAQKRDEIEINLAGTFLKSGVPAAQQAGATLMGTILQKRGTPVNPDALAGLATGSLKLNSVKEIMEALSLGFPPDRVADAAGIPVSLLPNLQASLGTDTGRRIMGLPTQQQERTQALEEQGKWLDNAKKNLGLGVPEVSKGVIDFLVKDNKNPTTATREDWAKAADSFYAHDLEKAKVQSGLQRIPMETTKVIVGLMAAKDSLKRAQEVFSDPAQRATVEKYVGPMLSGAPLNRIFAAQLPGVPVPEALTKLEFAVDTYTNFVSNQRGGLTLTPTEIDRVIKEAPHFGLKPEVFERRLAYAGRVMEVVNQRMAALSAPGGGERLLGIYNTYPMPEPPTKELRPGESFWRDPASKKVYRLKPGEKPDSSWRPL